MTAKPRTTRNKRPKNTSSTNANNDATSPGENASYFGSALDVVSTLSVSQKIGLGVSALALLSTAAVNFSASNTKKLSTDTKKGMGKFGGGADELATVSWRDSIKKGRTKGDKISSVHVTKAFQTCLASKRPEQQLIADQFYKEINKWQCAQLDVDGQTIVVNFLFWYYRSMNVPVTKFTSEQADHIRYWASFPTTDDVKWDHYNIKFDYLYSTALLQRSIPYMKKFYQWVCGETPRPIPDDASSRKPNYYMTRFQAACVLGDWQDGVKHVGSTIKALGSGGGSSKTDYFMHYMLRALEMPMSNPNFGLVYHCVDRLQREFAALEAPPPMFGSWSVLSFKYRNTDARSTCNIDQEFICASEKMVDDDGFYTFYPAPQASFTTRVPRKLMLWGRVCQMVSPILGAAGFLPLTGSWNDTKVYMQTSWTFRDRSGGGGVAGAGGNGFVRKHVIMRIERLPMEAQVESKDFLGKSKMDSGNVWRGYITVHLRRLSTPASGAQLYDGEGADDDYVDGEEAMQLKKAKEQEKEQEKEKENATLTQEEPAPESDKTKDVDHQGNGAVVANDTQTETQIYECELVISTDDASDKEKELKKRLYAAMNTAAGSNLSTPR